MIQITAYVCSKYTVSQNSRPTFFISYFLLTSENLPQINFLKVYTDLAEIIGVNWIVEHPVSTIRRLDEDRVRGRRCIKWCWEESYVMTHITAPTQGRVGGGLIIRWYPWGGTWCPPHDTYTGVTLSPPLSTPLIRFEVLSLSGNLIDTRRKEMLNITDKSNK